jgi:hypothetical protein
VAGFYLDHNVAADVARLLRGSNHAVITAHDQGLGAAGDDEHLLLAAQRGWTLVTHNRKDFLLLHDAWRHWASAWGVAEPHAGILIVPQPPGASHAQIAAALEALISGGPSLTNQLYLWRPASGWQHRR